MLTAAVRDLHKLYPGRFITEVRTSCPEVWENNPYVTTFGVEEGATKIDCQVPLIRRANREPWHYLHAIPQVLSKHLGISVYPTEFKGDIHLSDSEKQWTSQVGELAGSEIPFWIIVTGGKFDITLKWWATERYQAVVNHFRGRIQFVQVGDITNHHPKLDGVVDLRGKTNLRELIRLVYHCAGVVCPVTSLMHLAAAVPTKSSMLRPCIVIAGGREPSHWEQYPGHQLLHTIGKLDCCSKGGCWRDRLEPIGDGDRRDLPRNLCVDKVGNLPKCLDLIQPKHVIDSVESYLLSGAAKSLTKPEQKAAIKAVVAASNNPFDQIYVNLGNAAAKANEFLRSKVPPLRTFKGRGIVICAGESKYFANAYVCARMLRFHGCKLPIQFWHIGPQELDTRMREIAQDLGIDCIDGASVAERESLRPLGGWELKIVAILFSLFNDVLLLDADNVPLRDPEFLFQTPQFKKHGAIFWPDYRELMPERSIWNACGIRPQRSQEFESGQLVVDKARCWEALQLCLWYNNHSDFFYQHVHGDKETFHMAFKKVGKSYAMVPHPIHKLTGTMCQHDFEGKRLFQHRNLRKWNLFGPNRKIRGFKLETLCLDFLGDLRKLWDGFIRHPDANNHEFVFRPNTVDRSVFYYVNEENEYELPDRLLPNQPILDIGGHIGSFAYGCLSRGAQDIELWEADPENFALAKKNLSPYGSRVRLHCEAVWRSDQVPSKIRVEAYTMLQECFNTGGSSYSTPVRSKSDPNGSIDVPSVTARGFDEILKRRKQWHLVKLDCEGSEWPLLVTSNELSRIENLCGEYHLFNPIPEAWKVEGIEGFTEELLKDLLGYFFHNVRIKQTRLGALGQFWASSPRRSAKIPYCIHAATAASRSSKPRTNPVRGTR